MKKILIFALIVLLTFGGCKRAELPVTRSFAQEVARVEEALGGAERFLVADADFSATNFGAEYITERAVCFSQDGIGEWGLFLLSDTAHANECKAMLRDYLNTEKEAIESLAALYPADELQERLALYKNAAVGSDGTLVWYFALDKDARTLAEQAIRQR